MAFFANAFEVPLSILIEYTQRKVRSILKMVYVVDDIPFSISTFLPALSTFEMIELEHFSFQPPPLRPGVEGILISLGYQPRYLCNAVHLGVSLCGTTYIIKSPSYFSLQNTSSSGITNL